jgi:hypothetical protein
VVLVEVVEVMEGGLELGWKEKLGDGATQVRLTSSHYCQPLSPYRLRLR